MHKNDSVRVPKSVRKAKCAEYGIEYSPRQWIRLRKQLRRAHREAIKSARARSK